MPRQRLTPRSRKKNFSSAEVDALLRHIYVRRRTLFARLCDGVTLDERSRTWRDVAEAVNAVSGPQDRRTTSEVKKKWFDIKAEAKKRLQAAKERGDAALKPLDRRVRAIVDRDEDQNQDQDKDQDQDQNQNQNCPSGAAWDPGPCEPRPGAGAGAGAGLPTIVHITTVKREPQLSESEPSSTSQKMEMFTEPAQSYVSTERAQSAPLGRPDLVESLLQNQEQILDTLRTMASTFSQISDSLRDISESLKGRRTQITHTTSEWDWTDSQPISTQNCSRTNCI